MSVGDDHLQNHDVQILTKGLSVPVYINDTLSAATWRGGLWVQYTANTFGDGNNIKNIRVVGASDGISVAGFLIRGSDFHPNVQQPGSFDNRVTEYNYSSYKPSDTRVVTMMFDGSFVFKVYEKFAYPNRSSGTELTYSLNQLLYISERGYLTTLADATSAGISSPVAVGACWMVPSSDNHNRLGADIRFV